MLSVTLLASCELGGFMARAAHSAEFSENSPYLQGDFEKQKSKKTKC